jgi:hypothetical protein
MFDPNDLQINTRAKIQLNTDWSLWVGIDSLFGQNQPVLGVQLTR